jgi:hypothetical protein
LDSSILANNLLSVLNKQNIITLAQARNFSDDQLLSSYWLCSNDLGLEGKLAKEWDQFRWALIDSGALIESRDKLMWIGEDNYGSPFIKNFYLSIISSKRLLKVKNWTQSIWKWKVQLKIKLFIWLAMEGKILTWESLQKMGWEGPGRGPLCKLDSETIIHLFKLCPFAISV